MCGFFAGIFHPSIAPDEIQIVSALKSLGHRGPDSSSWVRRTLRDGRIAILGHARLSLVGVNDGNQPFRSDTHATVVNGEFYGWRNVRSKLQKSGASFNTQSDSEIAHHLYDSNGSSQWLSELDGEWSLAVIDFAKGSLHSACDPFGTKPLRHWSSDDGLSVAVSSEAKALFELGVIKELDLDALRFALALQYMPSGKTLFRNIGMVPPGHRYDHDRDGGKLSSWSDMCLSIPTLKNDNVVPNFLRLLQLAIERRIPEERSIATYLSGGLDSSLILALASRSTGQTIEAFTADFDYGPNEVSQAAETAAFCGARHIPVRMSASDLLCATDKAAFHAEGMCMNAHAAAKIILAKEIKSHGHRAVLTGEGADEAFWGYEHLRLDAGIAPPDAVADNIAGIHTATQSVSWMDGLEKDLGISVPSFFKAKASMTVGISQSLGDRLSGIYIRPERIVEDLPTAWLQKIRLSEPEMSARALWNIYGLSGYILRGLDDAMGMSSGVESRLAFLDADLQAAAAEISAPEHFMSSGMEKKLLREAAVGFIPQSVIERRKAPFMAPMLTSTAEGSLWAQERLLEGRLISSGLFEQKGIEHLLSYQRTPVSDANIMMLSSLSAFITEFNLG